MSESIRMLQSCLPDCMMPDGADPCAGYHAAVDRIAELEADRKEHAIAFAEYCYCRDNFVNAAPYYPEFLEQLEAGDE